MKNTSLRTRVLSGIIIGIIIGISSFIVTSTISNQQSDSSMNATIFSDIVESSDYPAFDMEEMTIYEPSYHIDSNLWNQPLIPRRQAIQSAMRFLRANLDEFVWENATISFCILVDKQYSTRPIWTILIDGPFLFTSVRVNAITGEIIGWNLSSASISISNSTPIDSYTEAEEIAYEFLKLNNYSIPSNAKYVGVKQYPYVSDDFYVEFQHFEETICVGSPRFNPDIPISYDNEGIILRVSKSIGQVTQFGYCWTVVGNIPRFGMISRGYAESIALDNRSYTNPIILGSRLYLTEVKSRLSSDGSPQLRVSWVIAVNVSNNLRVLWVDAFSGEFLQEMRTNGIPDINWETQEVVFPSYSVVAFALVLSTMAASVIWYSLRRRTYLE